jgi:quercetin dioxygenase-like cupin family protein
MRGVLISSVDASPEVPFPGLDGVAAAGTVSTRSVIQPDRPLVLWSHELAPGASIRWETPKYGHVLYVWRGDVDVDGTPLEAERVVVVEHNARVAIEAGSSGATLLHFHQSEAHPPMTDKGGGSVHIAPRDGLFSNRDPARSCTNTVWADAHCPTCDLWLHRSAFGKARPQSEPHMHNDDEIIFVVQGGTLVGRMHRPGTAIAVDRETIYAFGVDEGGTAFLNFRAVNPFVRMTERGKPTSDWISEWEFMRGAVAVPVIDKKAVISP